MAERSWHAKVSRAIFAEVPFRAARSAFGGGEPWDTFMSSLRSIPLIIDTEVKVGLSFQPGWHRGKEKKKFAPAIDFPLDSRPDRALPRAFPDSLLESAEKKKDSLRQPKLTFSHFLSVIVDNGFLFETFREISERGHLFLIVKLSKK